MSKLSKLLLTNTFYCLAKLYSNQNNIANAKAMYL